MHFPLLAELIVKKSGFSGNLGMILGSGLSSISNVLTNKIEISYQDLHGFPVSTVAGHDGKMVAGNLDDIPVIIASDRAEIMSFIERTASSLAGIGISTKFGSEFVSRIEMIVIPNFRHSAIAVLSRFGSTTIAMSGI